MTARPLVAGLSRAAALLAGAAALTMAVLISADVLLRHFLNAPLRAAPPDDDEVGR